MRRPTSGEFSASGRGGVTTLAGHRVEALEEGRSRLTLTLEMRGLLVPVIGRFYKGLDHEAT